MTEKENILLGMKLVGTSRYRDLTDSELAILVQYAGEASLIQVCCNLLHRNLGLPIPEYSNIIQGKIDEVMDEETRKLRLDEKFSTYFAGLILGELQCVDLSAICKSGKKADLEYCLSGAKLSDEFVAQYCSY